MGKIMKNKSDLEPATSYSSDYLRKVHLLVVYYLTKFGNAIYSVIPKITSNNLCKPIHGIVCVCLFSFTVKASSVCNNVWDILQG